MSGRRGKRGRVIRAAPRPIDKQVVCSVHATLGTTQQNTILVTATFPCTIVGVRWAITGVSTMITANPLQFWAIHIVKEGATIPTLAVADGASFYNPEQNLIAFGCSYSRDSDVGSGPAAHVWDGTTKAMRKMQGGDRLVLSSRSDQVASGNMVGVVQWFCKG